MIIFRYLTKEVYITLFVTTLVLLSVFMCNQFVRYMSDAALGRLTLHSVFQMMSIQAPLLLGFMLPLGLYVGILLSFGRFWENNEMTILQACGVSRVKILMMSLGFASLVAIVVAILMLWVEPKMAWYRERIFAEAAASPIEKMLPGRFQAIGNQWIVYVENIRNQTALQNVFAAHHMDDIITAKKGYIVKDNHTKNAYLVFNDGYRYQGVPGQNDYRVTQFREYGMQIPHISPTFAPSVEFMPTLTLWQQHRTNILADAQLQWRLAMPISVLILTLLAVPLSQVNPRQGRFARLLPAIIIYIIYINLIFVGESWMEKGYLPQNVGIWWIHIAMLMLSVFAWKYRASRS